MSTRDPSGLAHTHGSAGNSELHTQHFLYLHAQCSKSARSYRPPCITCPWAKAPTPHSSDRNALFPIEHGVPTPCHSPQNVYVHTGKCFNVQNPSNALDKRTIASRHACLYAKTTVLKQVPKHIEQTAGKPHLSAKQDRLSALTPSLTMAVDGHAV